MKKTTIQTIRLFALSLAIVGGGEIKAQTLGFWPTASGPSTMLTGTDQAITVGVPFTFSPTQPILEAWAQVRYCPPAVGTDPIGLLVTRMNCNIPAGNSGGTSGNGDPLGDPNNPGGSNGGALELPKSYFTTNITAGTTLLSGSSTVTLLSGINGGMQPLLWGRIENPAVTPTVGSPTPTTYNSRFMVLPDGRTGINVANPRATLDVVQHSSSNTTATALFGIKTSHIQNVTLPEATSTIAMRYSKQIAVYNNLPATAYNNIVQAGDQALIFTDGAGTDGINVESALVIAPWKNDNAVGGLRMDKDGNVLIKGKLELQGKLTCNGFVSKPQWWPDYVFEKNYHLISIDSVSRFIKLNKHLPGMPSEKEILTNGQDIAMIQQLQQQKIEELMLYIIDQNKLLHLTLNEMKLQNTALEGYQKLLNTLQFELTKTKNTVK